MLSPRCICHEPTDENAEITIRNLHQRETCVMSTKAADSLRTLSLSNDWARVVLLCCKRFNKCMAQKNKKVHTNIVKAGVELTDCSWKPHQVETPLSTSSETAYETQCALSAWRIHSETTLYRECQNTSVFSMRSIWRLRCWFEVSNRVINGLEPFEGI